MLATLLRLVPALSIPPYPVELLVQLQRQNTIDTPVRLPLATTVSSTELGTRHRLVITLRARAWPARLPRARLTLIWMLERTTDLPRHLLRHMCDFWDTTVIAWASLARTPARDRLSCI